MLIVARDTQYLHSRSFGFTRARTRILSICCKHVLRYQRLQICFVSSMYNNYINKPSVSVLLSAELHFHVCFERLNFDSCYRFFFSKTVRVPLVACRRGCVFSVERERVVEPVMYAYV